MKARNLRREHPILEWASHPRVSNLRRQRRRRGVVPQGRLCEEGDRSRTAPGKERLGHGKLGEARKESPSRAFGGAGPANTWIF